MSEFTRRIAWTGKVCLALVCAFFVGSLTGAVLAAAPGFAKGCAEASPDGAGMTLEQYEWLFGLDLANPANATADYDQDGLSNWEEACKGTDPFRADLDGDGRADPVMVSSNGGWYFWLSGALVPGFAVKTTFQHSAEC